VGLQVAQDRIFLQMRQSKKTEQQTVLELLFRRVRCSACRLFFAPDGLLALRDPPIPRWPQTLSRGLTTTQMGPLQRERTRERARGRGRKRTRESARGRGRKRGGGVWMDPSCAQRRYGPRATCGQRVNTDTKSNDCGVCWLRCGVPWMPGRCRQLGVSTSQYLWYRGLRETRRGSFTATKSRCSKDLARRSSSRGR